MARAVLLCLGLLAHGVAFLYFLTLGLAVPVTLLAPLLLCWGGLLVVSLVNRVRPWVALLLPAADALLWLGLVYAPCSTVVACVP